MRFRAQYWYNSCMIDEYLEKLVNFYPVSSDQQSVMNLLEYVAKELETVGLESKTLTYNGVHNVYAHTKGSKHSRLMLQGHIDVVSTDKHTFIDKGGKYYGRGTYDMLFATACYLQLFNELKDQLRGMDIAIMLSGDEELGGFNGVQPFLEDGYTTDVCILPDAGMGFGSLNIGAKGTYTCDVRINGQSHHGSRPWEGDGAAIKLVHFLEELNQTFDTTDQNNSTMTVSVIKAGDVENRGPAYADATLDIRYKNKQDLENIKVDLEKYIGKYDGEFIDIRQGDDYQLDTSHPDVEAFLDLYQKHTGKEIQLTRAHGSSDARFLSANGMPVIMLRPDGGGAHGDIEWVSKESVNKFYTLLKEYVLLTAASPQND